MAIEITVPRLGWTMEEGTFSAWLKQAGELVKAGEPLFVLESEKTTQDVESLDSGILHLPPEAPQPGATVKVGQLLGYLLAVGETTPANLRSSPARSQAAESVAVPSPSPQPSPSRRGSMPSSPSAKSARGPDQDSFAPANPPNAIPPLPGGEGRGEGKGGLNSELPSIPLPSPQTSTTTISPRALRVAAELGIEWTTVTGTGRTGRIREQDIRAAARTTPSGLSAIRRTIAGRMMDSVRNTAPVTLHTTADATCLVALRNDLKAAAGGPEAIVPSYTDLLAKLTVTALLQHPALNARWEGERLVPSAVVHLGVAVDTPHGLVVPVIRDASSLPLDALARRARDLIERARARKLVAEELRDGTFTITSLGSFGIDAFTPIIHYPECAILGVGRIHRQPAVVGDQIVPRDHITLSLTFDHRALDGAPAARFLEALCRLIESPQETQFANPKGIASSSPGLRGTSYPGNAA